MQATKKGKPSFSTGTFFDIFDLSVRRVASFEEHVKLLDNKYGFIDLFWKGVLLVEQKSAGRDLAEARDQAFAYFPGINDADLPRYLLLSDFQTFELYDLDENESVAFDLADLPEHVEKFGFILGVQKRSFKDQDPVNIKASERVGNSTTHWLTPATRVMIWNNSLSASSSVSLLMTPASSSHATFFSIY